MIAAQRLERRNVDHQAAPRPEHPEHLGDRVALRLLVQGIQDVERRDEIERPGGEWQACRRGAREAALAAGVGVPQAGPREVDPRRAAIAPEQRQVIARAAPAIEDLHAAAGGIRRISNDRLDELSKAAEPEMIALGARGGLEETVHRGKLGNEKILHCAEELADETFRARVRRDRTHCRSRRERVREEETGACTGASSRGPGARADNAARAAAAPAASGTGARAHTDRGRDLREEDARAAQYRK